MGLDIHSTITIAAVLSLMTAASLSYTLQDYPPSQRPSLRLWIASNGLMPVAWCMYGLRGSIPDLWAIVLANALLGLSYSIQLHALRRFVGLASRPLPTYAPVAFVVLAEVAFTYVIPSLRMRTVSVSLVLAIVFIMSVVVLLKSGRPRGRGKLLTAIALLLPAIVLIVRSAYEGLRTQALQSAFAISPMQTLVFGLATFLPIIATLGFVSMCNDRLHRELLLQAMRDPLTGIGNRRALDEAADIAIPVARRHQRPLAVLLADADHFKLVNDRFGHAAGDAALQALVAALQAGLRPGDVLGRLGGEEFAVILPDTDQAQAYSVAERLRIAVEAIHFTIQHEQVPLRVSIGIALLEAGDDLVTLLRRADQAMYFAKRSGRNCVIGPEQMRRATRAPAAG